jgi:3-oxoacyl-[acyl-carrier-protein] synthase-3
MSAASAYVQSGKYKKVLLIGADKMSSILDYTDRATCIIFGDGAGAALFEPNYEGLGLQDEILKSDGIGREYLKIDAGGSILPSSKETVENRQHFIYQDGKTVFKYAVMGMADVSEQIMKRNNLTKDDVNWLIAHQANKRIIDATSGRMELEEEKVLISTKLETKLSSENLLILNCDEDRSQLKNKAIVTKRFLELIEKALIVPKKRKATKIPKAVVEKRLKDKSAVSEIKENRKKLKL